MTTTTVTRASILILLATGASQGQDAGTGRAPFEPGSNAALIAAIPEGTESVMVMRPPALAAEGCFLKPIAESLPWADEDPHLDTVVLEAVREAGLLAWVAAGSKFTMPEDIGLGDYERTDIFISERPLTALAARLRDDPAGSHVEESFDHGGVTVYRGRQMSGEEGAEPLFAALVDDRTLVTSDDRERLEMTLTRLRDPGRQIQSAWSGPARHAALESPLVILRRFDPGNAEDASSPVNPRLDPEQGADARTFALWLPDPQAASVRFWSETPEPGRLLAWLNTEMRPILWTAHRVPAGEAEEGIGAVSGVGDVKPSSLRHGEGALVILVLFGWNVAL